MATPGQVRTGIVGLGPRGRRACPAGPRWCTPAIGDRLLLMRRKITEHPVGVPSVEGCDDLNCR